VQDVSQQELTIIRVSIGRRVGSNQLEQTLLCSMMRRETLMHRKLNNLRRMATTEVPVGERMRPCQLGQSNQPH
jgi:hypothetical protein